MKHFTQNFIGLLAFVFTMSTNSIAQQIGDTYQGGYVFQINEDGTALIVADNIFGPMSWNNAITSSSEYEYLNYSDWYIPSMSELWSIYQNISSFPFIEQTFYWSSSNENLVECCSWSRNLYDGNQIHFNVSALHNVMYVRSVNLNTIESLYDTCFSALTYKNLLLDMNQPVKINFELGWNMFGYTCKDTLNAIDVFYDVSQKIDIIKDELGLAYIPSWGFNALGNLKFSEGYQIKVIEPIIDFNFCNIIEFPEIYGCTNCEAINFNQLATISDTSCLYDSDGDGILDNNEVLGCQESSACNYNIYATDQGECTFSEPYFNCDGTPQIGAYFEGGVVFEINSDGSGKVVDINNLGNMSWDNAISACEELEYLDYNDWHLPTRQELELIRTTVGLQSATGNIAGVFSSTHWSRDEYNWEWAYYVYMFNNSNTLNYYFGNKNSQNSVKAVRYF